jgi:GT2 family glycosyltransferase
MVVTRALVVVVVLNWNGWRDAIRCISSVQASTYPRFEVVVVDNASTDHSVERISAAHPDVPVLSTRSNLGYSGGNNVGIRHALARGATYVWLLNNDVVVNHDALFHMATVAATDPRIAAVGSVIYDMDDPDRVQAWGGARVTAFTGRALRLRRPALPGRLHYIIGASVLLRSDALEELGLLDEAYFMYWDDADLGFRLRERGWELGVASDARVWHKESASLGAGSAHLDQYFSASSVRFFQRHARVPALTLVLSLASRLLKRLWLRHPDRIAAVWRGTRAGLKAQS